MVLSVEEKKLVFAFLEYLNRRSKEDTEGIDVESLEVACQCLSAAFSLDVNDASQIQELSIHPLSLPQVFALGLVGKEEIQAAISNLQNSGATFQKAEEEKEDPEFEEKWKEYIANLKQRGYFNGVEEGSEGYNARFKKARDKLREKLDKDKHIAQAEEMKKIGNENLQTGNYRKAVEYYSKAIEFNPSNAIYYANRAAAYTHLSKFEDAVNDAEIAISKDPNYSRAYSRLGLAQFNLGHYKESTNAYQKAVELDPSNQSYREALELSKSKIQAPSAASVPTQAPPGIPPGLSSLFSDPALMSQVKNFAESMNSNKPPTVDTPCADHGDASHGHSHGGPHGHSHGNPPAGAPPGMPGMENLLNPQMLQMAQQMMQQPAFRNMLSNPAIMNMARQFAQDPSTLQGLVQNFGGMDEILKTVNESDENNEEGEGKQ